MSPTLIAIAVVEHEGRVLVGPRRADQTLAGKWEFPGGKVESDETPQTAAARECLEETGLSIRVGLAYPEIVHQYEHDRVRLLFFACSLIAPARLPLPPYRWIERDQLAALDFPAANAAVVRYLTGPPR